ncbi:MAG: prolipoprotein diacylglyceryl transferase [Marinilabiliales bacterium]
MTLFYITWNVDPEIFSIGGLSIRYYGLLFASAFFFGYLIISKVFKKEGVDIKHLDRLTVYMALGTIIGARLGHCFFYEPGYYLNHPMEILMVWKGGLASHGGAIGILIALYLFSRKIKKPYIWILDRVVIVVALAGLFIRTGNLMNSEIVGKPTELPWGFIFVRNGDDFARHPAQIYEALSYFLIFIVLYFLYFKKEFGQKQGYLFSIFLIVLFTVRFLIEFVKDVQVEAEKSMTLNLGQWLSLPFIIIGAGLLIYYILRHKKKPAN